MPETPTIPEEQAGNLSDLFSKDPLLLTPAEEAAIVQRLRSARGNFALKEKKAKAAGKSIKASDGITLHDLGLGDKKPENVAAEPSKDMTLGSLNLD